jgi:pimeloyl-ACP methyl ester carboxylesterase
VIFHGAVGDLVGEVNRPDRTSQGTVLLLHGGGQTRHSWRRTGGHLAASGWTTVSYDARGHGDSDYGVGYAMDDFAQDISLVVEQLGVVPLVVGASMGGLASLLALGELRTPAVGLVLVDITPSADQVGVRRVLDFMASAPHGFASLADAAAAIARYNPHRTRPASPEGLRRNLRRKADGRWYWHWDPRYLDYGDGHARLIPSERLLAATRNISVPTLLVRGAYSDVVSDDGIAALLGALPHAEVSGARAGHMVAGDDNDVFASELLEFLSTRVADSRTGQG